MWRDNVGLLNRSTNRFLTAETFGYKVNANGTTLRRKQLWSLEPYDPVDGDSFCVKSHLNRYLAVDPLGVVTGDTESKTERCRFQIALHHTIESDKSTGNYWWTLRHMSRGHVLGCDEAGEMRCRTRQVISDGDLWHVQLLPAPGSTFFALKCGSRKRFAQAHANDLLERVQMDAGHAWGDVALFQMFHLIGCEYALRTTNGGWLRNDGICSPASNHSMTQPSQLPVECSFAIEPVANCIAFRDFRGLYLTGSASATLLKSKSDWAGKDEQFELQPASLQIQLRALFNQKWLSTRQGFDLAANQRTPEDEHETFELHFDSDRRRWQVTNKQGCYWSLSGGNVAASGSTGTDLELHWQSDGTCCFQVFPPEVTSSDRRWICARKSGQLFAGAAVSAPAARFWIQIWNRPRITLRPLSSLVNTNVVTTANGAFGFVGIRTNTSNRLDCSHIVPQNIELILVEQPFESFESSQSSALPDIGQSSKIESELLSLTNQTPTAICYCLRQCQNRKFWNLDAKQLVACASDDLAEAQRWLFEFRAPNELTIRAFGQKNAYITLNAQGLLQVVHCEPTNAFVWDF